ncbi:MAG: hypothetical protein AAFX32_04250 [Pseudomonadota bacterium]
MRPKVKPARNANLFRHQICTAFGMASKIIPFRRPEPASQPAKMTPAERAEALPEWAQELDTAWIFREADRRMSKPAR